MSNKEAIKQAILAQLKPQWKVAVKKQYETEPDKVKNADIDKNTNDICANPMVGMSMRMGGIKRDDIKRILTEIRDEVINGK